MNDIGSKYIINLPEYANIDITEQLKLVVMERENVPSFTFRLNIRGGAADDIPGKEGLHRLTGRLLKKGAGSYNADQFSEAVESLGGSLGVRTNYDYTAVIGDFLSKDMDHAFGLLADMIMQPRFLKKEVELSKKNAAGDIKAILDNPSNLCTIMHNKNIFGNHPYGRMIIGNPKSISSIGQSDMKNIYKRKIVRSRMLLTVVGDVKTGKVVERIKDLFSDLDNSGQCTEDLPDPSKISSRKIFITDKREQTQAHLRIGTRGISRNDTDYHGLLVANTYFGGSFTSRLMTEVRVKRGLTYGIRSAVSAFKKPGHITVITFTKNKTAVQAVELIFTEILRMQDRKITKKELENTQRYLTGLYPLSLETNKKIANKLSEIYLYDLPPGTVKDFRENVMQVTSNDVRDIARKYYSDKNTVITVLGSAKELISGFKKIGSVVKKDFNYYFK